MYEIIIAIIDFFWIFSGKFLEFFTKTTRKLTAEIDLIEVIDGEYKWLYLTLKLRFI